MTMFVFQCLPCGVAHQVDAPDVYSVFEGARRSGHEPASIPAPALPDPDERDEAAERAGAEDAFDAWVAEWTDDSGEWPAGWE